MSEHEILTDCPSCHGAGVTGSAHLTCWKCQGTGTIGRVADPMRALDEEPRRRGRPLGSKNKPREDTAMVAGEQKASVEWWQPVVRSGGSAPIVRVAANGKVSITKNVFDVLGINPKRNPRFRMGNDGADTILIQFAGPGESADGFPWELNQDSSARTRPVEMLDAMAWVYPARYAVEFDLPHRVIIVRRSAKLG